jgi:leucyl/phenylalanyl-tRNA--protein transferase
MSALPLLSPRHIGFPHPETALQDPNGLLAAGGDLSPEWLLTAYAAGIFPWFNDDADAILWWSPDPRAVLWLDALKVSRSLAKRLRNGGFRVTADCAFAAVVDGCRAPRATTDETWITPRMRQGYLALHDLGYAHSLEVWRDDELVGGLYGMSLGRMFFGESMFSLERDASKVAFCHLVAQLQRWGFNLIDCQIMNAHLHSLGAVEIPRREFLGLLTENNRFPTRQGVWVLDPDLPGAVVGGHGTSGA